MSRIAVRLSRRAFAVCSNASHIGSLGELTVPGQDPDVVRQLGRANRSRRRPTAGPASGAFEAFPALPVPLREPWSGLSQKVRSLDLDRVRAHGPLGGAAQDGP